MPLLPLVPFADRHARLAAVLARGAVTDAAVEASVRDILSAVRAGGDAALLDLAERFDGVRPAALRVPDAALTSATDALDADLAATLDAAAANVRRFHEREMPASWTLDDGDGVSLGQRIRPVDVAGLYVPAGTAPLLSSVIMNAIPALVAGVGRVVVCSPPGADGLPHPLILATCARLGLREVYAVGGAQAIAAMAYGTETVPRVDVVVGPGNAYVATAKRLVVGQVGIDSVAGPSEVVVLADATASATHAAADLLAQAEHDTRASAILVTDSAELAEAVQAEVERLVPTLPRADVLMQSLPAWGAVVVADSMDDAIACVDELAPEHLVILSDDADALWGRISHAGAVFLGHASPEPVGDYFAGPNHVLPTGGTARWASALGVGVFLRRQSVVRYSPERLAATGESIARFAEAEGLDAHALAVRVRLGDAAPAGLPPFPDRPMAPVHLVRAAVRAERPYRVPTTVETAAKLDQNESPFDLPAGLKEAAMSFLGDAWNRYPDDRPHRLIARLTADYGLAPGSVLVGRGSNEMVHTLGLCFIDPGTKVVLPAPMFALYGSVARMHEADIVAVPPEADLSHSADRILAAAQDAGAPLTIVTTPNNPTGAALTHEELRRLAAGVPGVLVVDEAYHEFETGPTAIDLLREFDNVIVMRTFSKAMGLAGLRLGVLAAAPAMMAEMEKARLPFLVDRMSESVGLAVLDRPELVAERVAVLSAERDALRADLAAMEGVDTRPAAANFFLFRTPLDAKALHAALAAEGVLVRDVTAYPELAAQDGRPGWLRVSVGTPAENRLFREALAAALATVDA